jgi:hypothetical protein
MGAESFANYGTGATVQEAFGAVTQQARYEYGHGGYTGTIAEKRSFHLLDPRDAKGKPLPFSKVRRAMQLSDEMVEGGSERLEWDPPFEILSEGHRYMGRKSLKLERGVMYVRTRRDLKPAKNGVPRQKLTYRKLTKAELALVPLARQIERMADDKWGPALAVQVTGADAKPVRERYGWKPRAKVFYFWGSASS